MKKKSIVLLLGCMLIVLLMSSSALYGGDGWTFDTFSTMMKKSGRGIDLDEKVGR